MVRVVISIILLLALCVLVVLNLDYTTPVKVFWVALDRVSIVAVGLVSFVLGVLYSFYLYAVRYIAGPRKSAPVVRRPELDRREEAAAAAQTQGAAPPVQEPAVPAETAVEQGAAREPSRKRGRRPRP